MNIKTRARSTLAGLAAGLLGATAAAPVTMKTHYEITARNAAGKLLWTETADNRVVTAGLNKLLDATFKTGLASPAWYIALIGPSETDGAMSSSVNPTFLTCASAPFTAGDAGRAIIVRGAAAAGADLVTTIASFTSSTVVVLSVGASTTVSGAAVIWEARAADTMASHAPWTESAAYSQGTRPAFTPGTISGGSVSNSGAQASYTIDANNTLIGGLAMMDDSTKSGTSGTLYGMAPFTVSFRQLNSGDTLSVTATLTAVSA